MHNKEDPYNYHNRFPLEWAKLSREVELETEQGDQLVSFMRSGSTQSPLYTDLFWMGDQLPTFDAYDGLNSALIGLLNGGLSGMTLGHSDIGGYTSVNETVNGYTFTILRDKEKLQRWIEMSTYSDAVMRTHPSNRPNENY